MFREQQIETFIKEIEEATTFIGPDNQKYNDEYIDTVLEEVRSHEVDLTQARVAIEKYVLSSLIKDPDDVVMMRIHDNIQAPIHKVIDIEIKLYGAPKYIVSKANKDASAWAVSAAAETPIQTISLPTDVAQEVMKYGFTTVTEIDVPTLPEKEPDVNDRRVAFFEPLVIEDGENTADKEKEWMDNFSKEASFQLIDLCLQASNEYYQVSTFLTDKLISYVMRGSGRSEDEMEYEKNCFVPDSELTPGEYVTTARNSSLRAFFTLLHITGEVKDEFESFLQKKLKKAEEDREYEFEEDLQKRVRRYYDKCIHALVKIYGKHPITSGVMEGIKLVFDFIDEDQRKHFYVALNDLAAFYEERRFYESSKNCYLLKEYLASEHKLSEETSSETSEEEQKTEKPSEESTENDNPDVPGLYISE